MSHHPPRAVWIVLAISTAIAIALFPIDHIYLHPKFIPVYLLLCAALLYGCYAGARIVFIINLLTLWIFPYETFKGIKHPLPGTLLTLAQLLSVVLLLSAWKYFWKKPSDSDPA